MQGLQTSTQRAAAAQQSEASRMLEAALLQMDGIISGAPQHSSGTISSATTAAAAAHALSERNLISATNVLATAKTLALALQQVGVAAPAPDPSIAAIINDWLETHIPRQDADERLRRLQRDKESLALQYQMLVERVSEQANRISELEAALTERTQQLGAKEELLQRQAISRSALETQKLELMSALSELKLHRAALERENGELRCVDVPAECVGGGKPPPRPMASSVTAAAPYGSMGNLNHFGLSAPKTPPAALRHQIHPQFHSLPRASHAGRNSSSINNNNNNNSKTNDNNNRAFDAAKQRNVAFASHEKILIEDNLSAGGGGGGGSGGCGNDLMYGSFMSQTHSSHSPSPSSNLRERSAATAKGLRNMFFGKLRRSNSGNLELPALEQADPEFRRGVATRATAGGRIEWTTQASQLSNASAKGYADWSAQEVCNWLCDLGLDCYEEDCRKWLKSNPSICFFTSAPLDIERELNLRLPLHRKKIQLAADELTGRETDALALKAAQLDFAWVLRWLDDIGLPQYKETFAQAKVDGRMLHRLTMEDLAQLHVTSCLHIASLRRGIQCMRTLDWDPECLIRRSTKAAGTSSSGGGSSSSSPSSRGRRNGGGSDETLDSGGADEFDVTRDEDDEGAEKHSSAESVALWTAHRVMEWLRVADLSEYAPNLRGAGVHGALMLYEPRFNAALLADLLSIPPSKTLLRRHLATHFKELLGRSVLQQKRDAEAAPGYQALTISAKLKAPKKTQFSLKRRKSTKGAADIEWTDYVCPMATATATAAANGGAGEEAAEQSAGAHNNSTSTASSSTTSASTTNNSNSLHSN